MNVITLPGVGLRSFWIRGKGRGRTAGNGAAAAARELDRLRILNAEFQHRITNTYALVQALAVRSAGTCATVQEFLLAFERRLAALARAQAQTALPTGKMSIGLRELVSGEITALVGDTDAARRVTMKGPRSVAVLASAAEIVTLGIHELAVNSFKYGVLSSGIGRIKIAWCWVHVGAERRLRIEWNEISAVPQSSSERTAGFGSELITHALPRQLGAATTYLIDALGVLCTINIPVEFVGDVALDE